MQDSFDITTLIFLALAVFVIWRLRSVLGQKTGSEQPPPYDPVARREPPPAPRGDNRVEPDNVVRLPGSPERTAASSVSWRGRRPPTR